jgi:hypothetical protein
MFSLIKHNIAILNLNNLFEPIINVRSNEIWSLSKLWNLRCFFGPSMVFMLIWGRGVIFFPKLGWRFRVLGGTTFTTILYFPRVKGAPFLGAPTSFFPFYPPLTINDGVVKNWTLHCYWILVYHVTCITTSPSIKDKYYEVTFLNQQSIKIASCTLNDNI